MGASVIYALAAGGFCVSTGRFWAALVWPWYLGALLGSVLSEKGIDISVKSRAPVTTPASGGGE